MGVTGMEEHHCTCDCGVPVGDHGRRGAWGASGDHCGLVTAREGRQNKAGLLNWGGVRHASGRCGGGGSPAFGSDQGQEFRDHPSDDLNQHHDRPGLTS